MLESKIVTVKNQRCGPEPQGQKTPCKRVCNTEGASVALTRHAAGRHVEQHHLDKQKIENVKNCHILRPQRFLDYKGSWTPKILGPQSSPDPKGLHHKGFQKTRQMAQSAWRSKPRTPSTRACSPARRTRITSERTPLTCLQHLGTPNLLVYALLDAARLDAASSPSTDACTTCALPSLPCWSAMLAPTCGRRYLKCHQLSGHLMSQVILSRVVPHAPAASLPLPHTWKAHLRVPKCHDQPKVTPPVGKRRTILFAQAPTAGLLDKSENATVTRSLSSVNV
ncbi:uncharacterized protein LOC133406784 isoform X4 [Phycodurus eques]|uniref:uncharacterized protein LOC133406784 isoform X4 n=1 Tax=Phycodurus eques TaxID=693459 RepID=UPI002ACDE3AE|nr:uncharacterized protein LOC133406784 isoform X4 [Phycodurus eques]